MEKSTKKKLGILLGTALTCLLLVAYAVSSIDTARLAKFVAAQVKASIGRDLSINGPVSIKVFPRLAVVADDVSLSNPSWASDPVMLKAQQVAFSLEWMPLFSQRIQIDNVTIRQLQLFLQDAPASQKLAGNWVMTPSADSKESASSSDFGLDLSQLHLNQLAISYKDAAGQPIDSLTATHFDIVRSGAKVKIDGGFNWSGLPLTLNGETDSLEELFSSWGAKPNKFAVNLNLGVNKQTAQVQGTILFTPDNNPVLDLNINAAALDLQAMAASMSQQAQSNVHAKQVTSNRVFSAQALPFNTLPVWQGQLNGSVGALVMPNGMKLESFKGVITATADDALVLQPLSFKIGSGQVVADGRLDGVHAARPQLQARATAAGFDFGHVMAQLGKGNLVSGGPTQAAFNVKTQGGSPAALAANANGALQFSVGAATVNNSIMSLGGDFLLALANAVNPLRKSNATSELTCLV
ncbi:MAG: AsmA family protein, partial [Rhodocyclales bacterium]|nr:AsmA family protein [Rhodocyclales bacterium]